MIQFKRSSSNDQKKQKDRQVMLAWVSVLMIFDSGLIVSDLQAKGQSSPIAPQIAKDKNEKNKKDKSKKNTKEPSLIQAQDQASLIRLIQQSQKTHEPFKTNLCLYRDGAFVSSLYNHQTIQQDGELVVSGLSSALQSDSVIIQSPDVVKIKEFSFIPDPSAHAGIQPESSSLSGAQVTPCKFVLSADHESPPDPNDVWRVQYRVNHVRWQAVHSVEFLDGEHINFSTVIDLSNQSGIPFKNARLQFLDQSIPKQRDSEDKAERSRTDQLIYRYCDVCDIAPYQRKNLIWIQAKRVAVTMNNGLFVGGKYLDKMTEPVFPQIENWIVFPNSKSVGLGIPIPGGDVAVSHHFDDFVSLIGYAKLTQVKNGENVFVRIPMLSEQSEGNSYSLITAQLVQESYKVLMPSMIEAEYKLSIQNFKNTPTQLKVTVDKNPRQKCSVARSNFKYEFNKEKEITWILDLPAKSSKELRYKLVLIQQGA